jgi:glucokinase
LHIVAGDIGGTSARLALFDASGAVPRLLAQTTYRSSAHPGIEPILADFLAAQAVRPAAIALGVAGPVRGGVCRTTNLPWRLSAGAIAKATGVARTWLLNDLEAAAWGVETVAEADRVVLQAGEPEPGGNQSVVAAGTGFGEAGRVWADDHYRPFASEGGHADFAPQDALDWAFQGWLGARHGHVSWDRIVSGAGIVALHAFLRDHRGVAAPAALAEAMTAGDPAAAITAAALARQDAVCVETLDRFLRHFGAEAGNHALKLMATGGVFITGGIAPKLLPRLKEGPFLDAFHAKGRMAALMRRMPVTVLTDGNAGLKGAALFGRRRAERHPDDAAPGIP